MLLKDYVKGLVDLINDDPEYGELSDYLKELLDDYETSLEEFTTTHKQIILL